jgi:hypothetical protein
MMAAVAKPRSSPVMLLEPSIVEFDVRMAASPAAVAASSAASLAETASLTRKLRVGSALQHWQVHGLT